MDRSTFVVYAVVSASLALAVGCDTRPSPPPPETARLVLAELRAASPGPWRRDGRAPIAITSRNQPGIGSYPPRVINRPAEDRPARATPTQTWPDKPATPRPVAPTSRDGVQRATDRPRLLVEIPQAQPIPTRRRPPAAVQNAGEAMAQPWGTYRSAARR